MKHKTKVTVISSLAILTGCVLTFFTANAPRESVSKNENFTTVYVTDIELVEGDRITESILKPVQINVSEAPVNAIKNPNEAIGLFVKTGYKVAPQSFVMKDFLSYTQDHVLSLELQEGEQTFALYVSEDKSLADIIKPNETIDIAFKTVTKNREGVFNSLFGKVAENLKVGVVESVPMKEDTFSRLYVLIVNDDTAKLLHNASKLGELVPLINKNDKDTLDLDTALVDFINDYSLSYSNLRAFLLVGEDAIEKEFTEIIDIPNSK